MTDSQCTSQSEPTQILLAVTLGFLALALVRLDQPAALLFDERYYIGAAIRLADAGEVVNREHPMLAKQFLALAWRAFGENLAALRAVPLVFGSAGLFFAARAVYRYSQSREAAVLFALLMATGFLLFGLSRLMVLEPFVFCFAALAYCQFAGGKTNQAAIAIGLALACKWTAAPLALMLGSLLLMRKDWWGALRFASIAGAAYLFTFIPGILADIDLLELPGLHLAMLDRLGLFVRGHPYASQWWEWFYGGGHVYLAHSADGITVLAGNPVSTIAGLAALIWLRDRFLLAGAVLCVLLLAFKPVVLIHQFLFLQSFLLAALAIALAKHRHLAIATTATSLAAFAIAFPALTHGSPFWAPWPQRSMDLTLDEEAERRLLEATRCLDSPRSCYF